MPLAADLSYHIEPVESYRLPRELPWRAAAFGLGLPCLITGMLGSTAGWSDLLITGVVGAGLGILIGSLRAGVQQERRRDRLALTAYQSLPQEFLARATTEGNLSERTRTLVAAYLSRVNPRWTELLDPQDADWAALRRGTGAPVRVCGTCGCGPARPLVAYPAVSIPSSGDGDSPIPGESQ
jgi:hypothetical protein